MKYIFFIPCKDYERKKHNCPDLLVNITDVKNEAERLFKQAGFDEQLSSSSILVRLSKKSYSSYKMCN